MKITAHEISLTQRHLWRSTREAIPVQHAVIVEVGHDGVAGFGEASAFMTDHYNSTLDQLHSDVRRVAPLLAELRPDDPFAVWEALAAELPRSPFALAAIDAAVHDLRARLLGVPMWEALGLDRPQGLRSSFSIGLDEPAVMVGKLRERLGWSAYKVKLADPADLTVLRLLRRHTEAPFYVDGNCGWELAQVVPALAEMQALGVSLIEQPFPRAAWTHARILKGLSPIPVIADESITSPADLDACTEAFHGINVKPMKAGGITPSLSLLRAARERGLITMLGCMPESAAGVSGTAHLGALADHLDVDVVDLLAVNTGHGLTLDGRGVITVPDRPGSGYLPDPAALGWRVRPVPAADVRPIRQQVLRPGQPVELCAYPEDDKPGVRHFGALQKGRMVGAASVYHEDPPAEFAIAGLKQGRGWRLRGMATIDEIRGTGAGGALLRTAVTHAVLAGADVVWCNARTSVADFYRRHGFRTLGEEFEMPGIGPHSFMYWSQTGRLTRRTGNPALSAVESGFPTITAAGRAGDDSFMTSYFPRQQEVPVIPEQAARTLTRIALTEAGVPASDASQVADALVDTSLRGIDTHGLRLLPQYLDELATGVANAEPDIQFVKDRGAGVMLDADGALGVLAGLTAARFAEQRARAYGVAAVGVRNSNHFGAASVYTRSLARHGLVGIAVTSAASRVAPYGGVEPLFGTNPISVAAGGQDHGDDEFALDMATSQVCFGEVKHRRAQGRPLDGGWATDADGHPTNDPDEAYALSPLGGYKGQGLAMLVTLLGGVLTGAPLDWQLSQVGEGAPGTGRGVGHLVLALDPGAFAGQMDFTAGLTDMLHTVRAAIPAIPNQPVLVPGDPQRAHERERRQDGIALDARTADVLTALAANHDLPGPTAAVVTDEGIAS